MVTMDLVLLNWLKDGKYRIATLRLLTDTPKLPSELANKLDINRASMSRILNDLRDKELIEQISSKSRTVTQKLTQKGKEAIRSLEGAPK